MPVGGTGPYQLRVLSARLRAAGKEGQGLRRELQKAVSKAARPVAAEVRNPSHLRAYMPNRYADVLAADLSVTTVKRFGPDPGVAIRAKGRVHKRKVQLVDKGLLVHPVFAHGPRKTWEWVAQTKRMRPGFFDDPMRKAAPAIRDEVLAAMHDVGQKITGG